MAKGKLALSGKITDIKVIRKNPTIKTRLEDLFRKLTFRPF